jgi:DNA-binding transcriptional LysR family regulator
MARPVRSADIAELRAFCAAIDLGSLGRAARLLRVTQPALSKRLRTLEALAGASLLDRSSRGVTRPPRERACTSRRASCSPRPRRSRS